jgi:hypothetical protein
VGSDGSVPFECGFDTKVLHDSLRMVLRNVSESHVNAAYVLQIILLLMKTYIVLYLVYECLS